MSKATVRAEAGAVKSVVAFAALPHSIGGDPTIPPIDKIVLLALLFWARNKATCRPSNTSIAKRAGISYPTVVRSLRRLEDRGLVARAVVAQGPRNPTGRIFTLCWRVEVAPGDEAPPPMSYDEYLETPHWQEVRGRALARAGHACAICPATTRLEVHHRTYERLGAEADVDLVVLCRDCHRLFHEGGKL